MSPERFAALWRSLLPIGRDGRDRGYRRYSWSPADSACREWFVEEAHDRNLSVDVDRNGNLWAWWIPSTQAAGWIPSTQAAQGGDPAAGSAVVTGSHLDSVPGGGGYDGALGVVSGLLAIDMLRERGVTPRRPIAVAVFTEEEGARFGVGCLGSQLLTGALDPGRARRLVDADGISLASAMDSAGLDQARLGPDPQLLSRIGAFVELHVEQGRALADLGSAVGVASSSWAHGRWRMDFTGEGNHAGTTRMDDRHDPMLACAYAVLTANSEARLSWAHATVGRVEVKPNATNAIPAQVSAWLDARSAEQASLKSLVDTFRDRVAEHAASQGVGFELTEESVSSTVDFHEGLRDRIVELLGGATVLPTGAGHDAGVLASHVPTAMLFVRNPSGVSHAPAEYASDVDCAAGVRALAAVLEDLACQ